MPNDKPKKLSPKEWNDKNIALGYKKVNTPHPTVYGVFYDPNKPYQQVDEKTMTVKDLPYITYDHPQDFKPAVSPEHKPIQFGNNNYNPNTGQYIDPATGKIITPIIEQYKNGGKVKGYANGTDPYGVTPAIPDGPGMPKGTPVQVSGAGSGYNYAFANANTGTQPAQPAARKNTGQIKQAATGALGAYGTGYHASQLANPDASQGDQIYSAGMGAVSSMGPIGGVIGGVSALGNQIGKPIRERSERVDEQGNLIDKNAAVRNYAIGSSFSPSKSVTNVLSDKDATLGEKIATTALPGLGSIMFANSYANRIEKRAKAGIAEEQKLKDLEAAKLKREQFDNTVQENLIKRDAGIVESDDRLDSNTVSGKNYLPKRYFKDGGTIKGKGTGTSDSIKGKIKEGSFIVPSKNNATAKMVRKEILGDNPEKVANTKQGSGPQVRVSDEEHLFTPEERQIIDAEMGPEFLISLAPDAQSELREFYNKGGKVKNFCYSKGGDVKGYANGGGVGDDDFVKKEKARIESERKADAAKYGEARARQLAEQKKQILNRDIKEMLRVQNETKKNADAEYKKQTAELDALRKSYDNFTAQREASNKPLSGAEAMIGNQVRPTSEDTRKEQEKLLKMIEDKQSQVNEAKGKLDYASNERNFINSDFFKGYDNVPAGQKKELQSDPYGLKKANQSQSGGNNVTPKENILQDDQLLADLQAQETQRSNPYTSRPQISSIQPSLAQEGEMVVPPGSQPPMRPLDPNSVVEPPADPSVVLPTTTADPASLGTVTPATSSGSLQTQKKAYDWGGMGSTLLNYGIPIAQAALGYRGLKNQGARPVDSLDSDFLNSLDQTQRRVTQADQNARYGLSSDERAMLDQQNLVQTNAARAAARNLAGGSSSTALNLERAASNDFYNRALQTRVLDNNLKLQKQQFADQRQAEANQMAYLKQNYNRQLFGDSLNAFHQKQQANAGLLNSGINNFVSANRYEQEKGRIANRQNEANNWLTFNGID